MLHDLADNGGKGGGKQQNKQQPKSNLESALENNMSSTTAGDVFKSALAMSVVSLEAPPVALGILGAGALAAGALYLVESSRPKLVYTYEHPSQNPIHNAPNHNPRAPNPKSSWGKGVLGGITVGVSIYKYKEYVNNQKQIPKHLLPKPQPKDHTHVAPKNRIYERK